MRAYGGSLRAWRLALPSEPGPQLRLYLAVFADVLRAVQVRWASGEGEGEGGGVLRLSRHSAETLPLPTLQGYVHELCYSCTSVFNKFSLFRKHFFFLYIPAPGSKTCMNLPWCSPHDK